VAEWLTMPLATSAIKALAEANGGCIQLRLTDVGVGQIVQILVPCGATSAAG
jgi:hypothetical protein